MRGSTAEKKSTVVHSANARALDILVRFDRNAEHVVPLFQSFQAACAELDKIVARIVVINESPEDAELRQALNTAIMALSPIFPCRLLEFARKPASASSVNAVIPNSVADGHDVLLLHSDTVVFPGTLLEMQKVAASDPLIGFVNPRSNNASVCTFPQREEFQNVDPAQAHTAFRRVCGDLPEFHFVPAGEGFCLWIKLEVLEEFGLFDEGYRSDSYQEKELMMRANRCGYRVALANHAFVYHAGKLPFADRATQEQDAALLSERYPEYAPAVSKYFNSTHYQAEGLLTTMLSDGEGRLDLLFDFSSLAPYHNGTFELSKEILLRATTWRQFKVHVLASEQALRFHGLNELETVSFVSPGTARKFALAFRIGQPFDYEQLHRMSGIAPLNVYIMLDPIAFDCLYLNKPGLDTIWGSVFAHADAVIYISDFAKEQFWRRFRRRPGLAELVAYPSLDYHDYVKEPTDHTDGDYILVIGNAFAHKRVSATLAALSLAFPSHKIAVLGLSGDHGPNVISHPSGYLSEQEMDQLWRRARIVVFPSVYEGFGFPIVKSLAYRKPILARSIPTTQAIKEKLNKDENLILYSSTLELIQKLRKGFPAWKTSVGRPDDPEVGWEAIAEEIRRFLCVVCRSVSFADVLLPRLQHTKLLDPSGEESRQAGRIQEIYNSWSWRLTAPLRRLVDIYLRFKTWPSRR